MSQNLEFFTPTSPRRSALPKGKACMSCRRRKIKCDGRSSHCRQSPGADDCRHPLEVRNDRQELEETINKLQTRTSVPEATRNGAQSSISFHEPYNAGVEHFRGKETFQFVDSWPPGSVGVSTARMHSCFENKRPSYLSPAASTSSCVTTLNSTSNSSDLSLEEPPSDVAERLVDAFLDNFSQVGFFLHGANFRHSALLAVPSRCHDRPLSALLSAVYMWGSRFSAAPRHPVYNEDAFLVCTLQNLQQDLGGNHPHRVVHSIQAEILLSLYYLTLGRPVEGIHHSGAAVSLAISAGLHFINSESSIFTVPPVPDTSFPPPSNGSEMVEQINAFWTVVIVNNHWVVAYGSPSAIPYCDMPIDTPWPIDFDGSVSSDLFNSPLGEGGEGTVSKFLSGLSTESGFSSELALHSKASILLEQAITFSARYAGNSPLGEFLEGTTSDDAAFDSLDALLEQFMLSLPLGFEPRCVDKSTHRLLVTQTLTHVAIIRLHAHRVRTSEASRRKYMTAALTVVHIINNTDFSKWRHIDPIMGILWTTVCDVFVGELSNMESGGVVALTEQYQDLTWCLETILSTMRSFAGCSPLIEHSCAHVQEAYGAVIGVSGS
ncbi:hypothetical protein B0H13DRAFT_878102 [Mycena leptocephala]|nr:hypothetical protein B0H13DRAFT_878102 [Mycena leptocephala]